MGRRGRYSPEVRERAVRMVLEQEAEHDSQWAAIRSIASKVGCSAEALRNWVRQAERDQRDQVLREEIQRVHQENHDVYGAEKVWRTLNRQDIQVPEEHMDRYNPDRGVYSRWLIAAV